MSRRPKFVTFISWINIILGFLILFSVPMSMSNPNLSQSLAKSSIPINVQLLQICISSTIAIISGFFMLSGANWARILYVAYQVIGITIEVFQGSTAEEFVPQILGFMIIFALLFRTKSNEFFSR